MGARINMDKAMLSFDKVNAHYGKIQALHDVSWFEGRTSDIRGRRSVIRLTFDLRPLASDFCSLTSGRR